MLVDAYPYKANLEYTGFKFESVGPKGIIKKEVEYTRIHRFLYSLGFWDVVDGKVNDKAISNNSDRQKILNTIAATFIDFMDRHPGVTVFATGSTPARTRLYQMGIAANMMIITQSLHVQGYYKGKWEPFLINKNYKAFLAESK